nr:MAG: hypothetical protein [Microvirus sp.]
MKWKMKVRDLRGNIHTHRFSNAEAAWNHWVLYYRDVQEEYYEWVEMWKKAENLVVTGEEGEQVWILQMRFSKEL